MIIALKTNQKAHMEQFTTVQSIELNVKAVNVWHQRNTFVTPSHGRVASVLSVRAVHGVRVVSQHVVVHVNGGTVMN